MYSRAGALISLWALLFRCSCGAGDGLTVQQVQDSRLWKDERTTLVLTRTGFLPDCYLKALEKATSGSNVAIIKVACQTEGDKDVCPEYLTDSYVAVRVDGLLKGLDANYSSEQEFVTSVLELLLSSHITQLWSYTDLTEYGTRHSEFLLALAPNDDEYSALLSAMLVWPTPLGVAMTTSVLPLSRRYQYSAPPSLLQLWYVVEWQWWYSNQDTTGFNLHVVQKCKTPERLIREFVERVHYPIVTDYKDDTTLRQQLTGSGLHVAIVFPRLDVAANDNESMSLAVNLAQKTFMNYAFIIMSNRSRLRRFVTVNDPSPHIVILPYGTKADIMRWAVIDGRYPSAELQHMTYALRAYAVMNPRLPDGHELYPVLGPSVSEVSEIKQIMATRKHHIFAYFCLRGQQQCAQVGYKVIREVLSVLRVTELGQSFGAHVVLYKSTNAKPFKLKSLIRCAMYNHTTKAWSVADEEITTGSKALHFISQVTQMKELGEVARAMLHITLTLADVPPPPKSLQEDDPFNLVALSLPQPLVTMETQLTPSSFHQHITKFNKTVVVFCIKWSVRCDVFYHHIAAANKKLDTALHVSLATVACDNHTELCSKYNVSSYPTALLFTPTTTDTPTPISGVLDSTHLLSVLAQTEDKKHNYGSLVELTPRSLPRLLPQLSATLVLWCDREPPSDKATAFIEQASNTYHSNLTFAWINSDKQSRLLSHIVPTSAHYPAVVVLNFKKHSVHFLSVEGATQATISQQLTSFIRGVDLGSLEPTGYLSDKAWLPLQPPITFPSSTKNKGHHSRHQSATRNETPPTNHHSRRPHPHTEL